MACPAAARPCGERDVPAKAGMTAPRAQPPLTGARRRSTTEQETPRGEAPRQRALSSGARLLRSSCLRRPRAARGSSFPGAAMSTEQGRPPGWPARPSSELGPRRFRIFVAGSRASPGRGAGGATRGRSCHGASGAACRRAHVRTDLGGERPSAHPRCTAGMTPHHPLGNVPFLSTFPFPCRGDLDLGALPAAGSRRTPQRVAEDVQRRTYRDGVLVVVGSSISP